MLEHRVASIGNRIQQLFKLHVWREVRAHDQQVDEHAEQRLQFGTSAVGSNYAYANVVLTR